MVSKDGYPPPFWVFNRVVSPYLLELHPSEGAPLVAWYYSIMTQKLRNKIGHFDDRISLICSGLWNLDLAHTR